MLNTKPYSCKAFIAFNRYVCLTFAISLISLGFKTSAQAPVITYSTPQTYTTGTAIVPLVPNNSGGVVPATFGSTTVLAGNNTQGAVNGIGTAASFRYPFGVVCDAAGNVYVADYDNNEIRKITPAGLVSTFAGSGARGATDGTGTAATFFEPTSLAIDALGNIYVADMSNSSIRKITPTGIVSTLAGNGLPGSNDGVGTAASFNFPTGVAVDGTGNVYVADRNNYKIRKITPQGVVTTIAGNGSRVSADGIGTAASFNNPETLTVDGTGNIFVTDYSGNTIRKVTPTGVVTTVAGNGTAAIVDGQGTAASFNRPIGITINNAGYLFVTDFDGNALRVVSPTGLVTTVPCPQGSLSGPSGPGMDNSGNLYLTNEYANTILKIITSGYYIDKALPPGLLFDPTTGIISGNPTSLSPATTYTITAFNSSGSSSTTVTITVNNAASVLPPPNISYQTPQTYTVNTPITALAPANTGGAVPATIYGQVSTFAGLGSNLNTVTGVAADPADNVYIDDWGNDLIKKVTPAGVTTVFAGGAQTSAKNGQGTNSSFFEPDGIVIDALGNLYIGDQGDNLIRKITPGGLVSTLAGGQTAGSANGTGTGASFNNPRGLAVDQSGNVFVADQGNNLIREITPAGVVTTLAGNGNSGLINGTGTNASFNTPTGVGIDLAGNIYVADAGNNAIRKITPAGVVTTFATGFNFPREVRADGTGNLYVSDQNSNSIKRISPSGVVTTIAGTGGIGATNGNGNVATFNAPLGLSLDGNGNLFVGDNANNLVRKVIVSGYTIDKVLPPGLSFDPTTGIISGTPTVASTATNYTVTAYNGSGSSSSVVTIKVATAAIIIPAPPNIRYQTPQSYTVNTPITALAPINTGGAVPATIYGQVTTFAGSGAAGFANGQGTAASFNTPYNLGIDQLANIYVADYNNQVIRKITPAGLVSTFAGNGISGAANGPGLSASFYRPGGITTDASGNVYVGDQNNNLIRMITPAGVVSTYAGTGASGATNGNQANSSFNGPTGLSFDNSGNLYIADRNNNIIRKITPAGTVSTFAGNGFNGFSNGIPTAASFSNCTGTAVDQTGNVYVSDQNNNVIRIITPTGTVSTFAGSGQAGATDGNNTVASFNRPFALTVDYSGTVYVADEFNNLIRKIAPYGAVTTLAGNGSQGSIDGLGTAASFNYPAGVALDELGNLFVTDAVGNKIRKIVVTGYTIDKPLPAGLIFDPTTGIISGTPTAASPPTNYTVTAYNVGGSSITIVNIEVVGTLLPSTITFQPIPAKLTCDADFSVGASSSNTVTPLIYSSNNTAVATISAQGIIHIVGAGTTTITIAQSGNSAYAPAIPASQTLTISTPALPVISISASANSVYPGVLITFTAALVNTNTSFSYQWQVNGVSAGTNSPTFTTSSLHNGDEVTCMAILSSGCIPSVTSNIISAIIIPAPSVTVVNTFTPNGDGVNDLWIIPDLVSYPNCLVSVFNRYGTQIFQSRGYAEAWDGTYKGHALPMGTYYYVIELGYKSAKLSGHVTIVR